MRAIFILLLVLISSFAEMGPQNITYMTEHYPPNNYVDEYGTLQGYSVELLKEIWKEMNCPAQNIQVVPWARGYMNIQTNSAQMLFTMVHTKSRDTLFKWVGPLSSSAVILAGKNRGKGLIYLNNLKDLEKYRVGVIRSDVGEQMLLSKSVPGSIMKRSINMREMIGMLNSGEVDLICLGDQSFRNLQKNSAGDAYYFVYTVETIKDYYAFSKDVPDSLIREFQKALDNIQDTQKALLKKWNMRLFNE